MNGVKVRIFVLCFMLSCGFVAAQTKEVEKISAEKTVIDQVEYYVHRVRSGESLSSLSAMYKLSQKEIVMANPSLLTGQIRAGQTLYIPAGTFQPGRMEDDRYVFYVAVKGDTKNAIARQFGVNVADLDQHNPELAVAPLKIGQVVKVPKPGADFSQKEENSQTTEVPEVSYETHKVKARETLFAISRLYDIPVSTLLELNPELNKRNPSVKVGQEIKLKEIKVRTEYLQHVVQRRETIQSIAQAYKVSLNALLDLNPNLNPVNPRVSEGQVIRIPIPVQRKVPGVEIPTDYRKMDTLVIKPVVKSSEEKSEEDQPVAMTQSEKKTADCTTQQSFSGKTVRIALLVPLYLNSPLNSQLIGLIQQDQSTDSLNTTPGRNSKLSPDNRSLPGLELCEGALLAVEKFRQEGLQVEIEIFDTERDENLVRQILSRPELKKKDLIVGPFFSDLLPQIARFCAEEKIPFVSPASGSGSIPPSAPLFQINPSVEQTVMEAINRLNQSSSGQETLLLTDIPESNSQIFGLFKAQLEHQMPGRFKAVASTSVESIVKGHPLTKTRVIILSENEGYVMKALAMLNVLYRNNHDIQIIGLPEWRNFNNIDIEYFHNLQYTYLSAHYTNYKDPGVIEFLQRYRACFATEPSAVSASSGYLYGFMGYDLVRYFGSAIALYGKPFEECLKSLDTPLLQTRFSFSRNSSAPGFINSGTEMVKYTRDLYIERMP